MQFLKRRQFVTLILAAILAGVTALPAYAKGPVATPPPFSITVSFMEGSRGSLSPLQLQGLSSLLNNIEHFYRVSLRPRILELLLQNTDKLNQQWLDSLRISILRMAEPRYLLTAYVYSIASPVIISPTEPISDPTLTQTLDQIRAATLEIFFYVRGPYFRGAQSEFFAFADQYVQRLNALAPGMTEDLGRELNGKGVSAISFTMLDERVVRVRVFGLNRESVARYYGTEDWPHALSILGTKLPLSEQSMVQAETSGLSPLFGGQALLVIGLGAPVGLAAVILGRYLRTRSKRSGAA